MAADPAAHVAGGGPRAKRSDGPPTEDMVRIEHVSKRYGAGTAREVVAIDDVSLTIRRGEVVALLGPSGCGKSTILRMVGGLLAATEGRILIGDEPVTAPSAVTGIMFQKPVLFPWLTVVDNILLPTRIGGARKREHRAKALELIDMVGLKGFSDNYPRQLSGGMQQRVAICRMFINEPELLLLDEPFGALDEMTREYMDAELRNIIVSRNRAALLVTHSPLEAAFVADRVVVLTARPGRVAGSIDIPMGRDRPMSLFSSAELHQYVSAVRALLDEGHGGMGSTA